MRNGEAAAMGCTAIISALFANSSVAAGGESGFATKRVAIWRDTDPDRCGLLHFVFDPDFGYPDYVEWALDIPMFFILMIQMGWLLWALLIPRRKTPQ